MFQRYWCLLVFYIDVFVMLYGIIHESLEFLFRLNSLVRY